MARRFFVYPFWVRFFISLLGFGGLGMNHLLIRHGEGGLFVYGMALLGALLILYINSAAIYIGTDGVKYWSLDKRMFMSWEEIDQIIIRPRWGPTDFLWFSTGKYDHFDPWKIGPDLIGVSRPSRALVAEVEKYWPQEILGKECFEYY